MIRVATPAEMREADRLAIESRGASGLELMERAGLGAAEEIRQRLRAVEGVRVVVVCGKGNNGGDGFVVARHLHGFGARVRIFAMPESADAYSGDARDNLERLKHEGTRRITFGAGTGDALRTALADAVVVVDALLGTGFTGAVRAPMSAVIEAINALPALVVALDVPSGVDGSTGAVEGPAVRAALTTTFAAPKIGLLFHPGRSYAGDVRTIDIGIPDDVLDEAGVSASVLTDAAARERLPRRKPTAHKGDAGRVLVAGGSVGMTGAVALASTAALRTGAGLVTAAVPASLNDILEVKLTEVMTLPCRESTERTFAEEAAGRLVELAESMDALAIGPGLSRAREAAAFGRALALGAPAPAVIDADGLNAFEGRLGALAGARGPRVLTPHPGEAARLAGVSPRDVLADPPGVCRRIAAEAHAVVLLKGATTVIGDGTGGDDPCPIVLNPTGNAGLATGGTGDVLTGIITGFIAQGVAPFDAACLGAFVHGAAGDLGRDRLTEWGLVAGDLVDLLPETLGRLERGEGITSWVT